jgi:NAD(P)-dependent dehydrogenase (short-subunit alcohol dehydrogenase family)
VINIFDTRGCEPNAHSAMSGPINFGTLSITMVMASEFGRYRITVNAIAPGSTATRRFEELVSITARERGVSRRAAEKHLLREVPLGHVIRPEDVAAMAVFLASKPAELVSSCAINVDGGRTRSIWAGAQARVARSQLRHRHSTAKKRLTVPGRNDKLLAGSK